MGFIFLFIVFIIICFVAGWYTLGIVLTIIAVVFTISIIISIKNDNKRDEERKRKEQELKVKKEEELKNVIIPAYNKSRAELINKYGDPTKEFILEKYNIDKEIIAFEKTNRVWICGKDFPMGSILGCKFSDNKKVVKGQITSTTKTNNKNMVKRAVVGGVLTGGTGAVIGGTTARKTTVSTQENDKVYHDYTIVINIDSLSDPILRIPIGSDGNTVNEIVAMMNVIINRRFTYQNK